MKKNTLVGIVSLAAAASSLAQGTVVFEDAASVGAVTLNTLTGPYAVAGTYTMALLWAPGGTLGTAQSAFVQIATFGPAGTQTGFFTDPNPITVTGQAGGTVGVFEVQGWQGSYANYAAAVAAGGNEHVGQSGQFLNTTGNPNPPATPPINTTGWDGNLILVATPEPGTLALGGLGAAALMFFRRRK